MGVPIKLKGIMERFFGWKVLLEIKRSNITVVQKKDERVLLSHDIVYSKLKDESIYTHSYWDYFIPMGALQRNTKMLILGLGGGTIPNQMNTIFGGHVSIDAVEMNKDMVRASKVFLQKKLDTKIIIGDAASYIKEVKNQYDIVILDIFYKLEVPDNFVTSEFIEDAYNALKDNGVLAVNYTTNELVLKERLFKQKLRKRFPKVYTIREPRLFGNRLFICSKRLSKDEILKRMNQNFKKDKENEHIFQSYEKMR